ncbi:putative ABC transporter permease [Candidatus Stoquefichus massiliensis]|uniref:putative ABC transporter permease n=1 Tax=Candidatus Stoquefichus massiliensis TaxID=1470350 RepID=UPI0004864EF3|nr:putative ABC transporter permease [Candidatus Stoquefichus massiliensis]
MNIKTFAKGYNIYKLIWIFLSCSFIGSIIEMIWCYFTMDKLMSRSSLLYGQFSIVWGMGCVLLTILLHNMEGKRDLSIFCVGTLAGGIYEYICGLLAEGLFGVRFWDYSDIPFNIDGRVNLLFCFFWGLIAVVWVQNIYPFLSQYIEKIPMKIGKPLTWILVVFMIYNMSVSALALIRSYQRHLNISPNSCISEYLDENYPDEYLEKRYQNMKPK